MNALLDAGLVPGVKTEAFDPAIAAGSVVATDPAAGTEVEPGSPVDYVVSLGIEPTPTPEPTPAPVVIPDLRGFTPDDAVNAILDLGLQPGQRTDKFNGQVTDGLVIRTVPDAGTEVQPGSPVDYVVSRGAKPSPTPEPTLEPTPEPTPEPTLEPTPEPTPATVVIPDVRGFGPRPTP